MLQPMRQDSQRLAGGWAGGSLARWLAGCRLQCAKTGMPTATSGTNEQGHRLTVRAVGSMEGRTGRIESRQTTELLSIMGRRKKIPRKLPKLHE